MLILELLSSGENQVFVIGAKAMIGMAFAAIAYGMKRRPERPPAREHERDEDREPAAEHEAARAPPGT